MKWTETAQRFRGILEFPIYRSGSIEVRLWDVVQIGVLFALVFAVAWIVHRIVDRLLAKTRMHESTRYIIARLINYLVIVFGALVVIQTAGVNLAPLALFAGAIGVGLGFGLQNLFSNFVSGIILLVERPIKVGDFVDLGDLKGRVQSISLRSTVLLTNDNINVIVPNSDLVSQRVINWSHNNRKVRFRVPIGVAYGTDDDLVSKTLLKAAANLSDVLEAPAPTVFFVGFGDSSLNFEVVVWTEALSSSPDAFVSKMNYAILKGLREAGITIPFPQRDVHLIGDVPAKTLKELNEKS